MPTSETRKDKFMGAVFLFAGVIIALAAVDCGIKQQWLGTTVFASIAVYEMWVGSEVMWP